MRLIRPIKPFFAGEHSHAAGADPFELDEVRAQDLVKAGLAQYVVVLPELALAPAPAAAEQAISTRQRRRA